MCAHGYDNWKQTNPADTELGGYECHYCGTFFVPDHDNEKQVLTDYGKETILVCDRCCKVLAGELHRRNAEGLATIIHRGAE
jgi:uncharacterized Zn finger protein